jgi:hypothetical protein
VSVTNFAQTYCWHALLHASLLSPYSRILCCSSCWSLAPRDLLSVCLGLRSDGFCLTLKFGFGGGWWQNWALWVGLDPLKFCNFHNDQIQMVSSRIPPSLLHIFCCILLWLQLLVLVINILTLLWFCHFCNCCCILESFWTYSFFWFFLPVLLCYLNPGSPGTLIHYIRFRISVLVYAAQSLKHFCWISLFKFLWEPGPPADLRSLLQSKEIAAVVSVCFGHSYAFQELIHWGLIFPLWLMQHLHHKEYIYMYVCIYVRPAKTNTYRSLLSLLHKLNRSSFVMCALQVGRCVSLQVL